MRTLLCCLLVTGLVACGDDSTPAPDGSVLVDGGASAAAIPWLAEGTPPIAPPTFTPCPPGWREGTVDGTTHCEPFPEGGAVECPAGQAHFVGEAACVVVGDGCPAGDFADALPADGTVVYVRAGGAGGDGSLAAPHAALSEVSFGSLPGGTTIALARGTYPGALPLRAGVAVVGACAEGTFLSGVAGSTQALVTVASAGELAELRNVTVRNPPHPAALVSRAGGGLRVRGVIVDGATPFALGMSAGELDVEAIVVRSTRDTLVGESGMGLYAVGGSARIARAVFDDNHYAALYGEGADTEVSVADAHVHDTTQDVVTRTLGRGLNARRGARFEVSRTLFSTNRDSVTAADEGSFARLEDVVVRDTLRDPTNPLRGGYAVAAAEGGRIEGTRVLVDDNDDTGLFADTSGASIALSDCVVRDVRADGAAPFPGFGVDVFDASAELSRVVIERSVGHGVLTGDAARLVLTDLVVRDIRPRSEDELFGRGIGVQSGAIATVERALFERTAEVAVLAADATTELTLTDIVLRDTRARPTHGDFGRGLVAQLGARVDGARLLIEHMHEVGALASSGAELSLRDVVVADTRSNTCTTGDCADTPFGYGVAGLSSGAVDLSAFAIRDAELCGVFVDVGAAVMLSDGEVSGAAIGACVQDPGYDLDRLSTDVAYRDNGTNLDTTSLPVPDPNPPAVTE